MSVFIPAISIILITCLLIFSMYFRAACREKKRRLVFEFSYEELSWKIEVIRVQIGPAFYAKTKIVPGDLLSFSPQVSFTVSYKNKKIINVPNFWCNFSCFAFCGFRTEQPPSMQVEAVFKDLLMARAFVKKLFEIGYNPSFITAKHNKIIFLYD